MPSSGSPGLYSKLMRSCSTTSGRFCTSVMERFGQRVFVKTGAEGVFCAALPEQGLGLAVKCDDGAGRAADQVVVLSKGQGKETARQGDKETRRQGDKETR